MRRQNRPSRPFSRGTRRVKVSDAVLAVAAHCRRHAKAFFGKKEPIWSTALTAGRCSRRWLCPWRARHEHDWLPSTTLVEPKPVGFPHRYRCFLENSRDVPP
jgi:hypothetical protein